MAKRKMAPMFYTIPKLAERADAIRLRQQGLSYAEITEQIPVTLNTLSRWLKHIELTPEQQKAIRQRRKNKLDMLV